MSMRFKRSDDLPFNNAALVYYKVRFIIRFRLETFAKIDFIFILGDFVMNT